MLDKSTAFTESATSSFQLCRYAMMQREICGNCHCISLPLHFATLWGDIGPKTQIGYGVVDVCDEVRNLIEPDAKSLLQELPNGNHQGDSPPDLRHFFFAILEFKGGSDWWKRASLIDLAIGSSVRLRQAGLPKSHDKLVALTVSME
jgi:hypothetical protein